NNVPLQSFALSPIFDNPLDHPITFTIPNDMPSAFVTFTLTLTVDSLINPVGTGEYVFTYQFDTVVGRPQILLVDDDGGKTYETRFSKTLNALGRPHDVWDKSAGSPTATDLLRYRDVIWFNGGQATHGTFTADDIAAMKGYLDGGGNLLLEGIGAPQQLANLDSAFVANYLHATVNPPVGSSVFRGYDVHELSRNTVYEMSSCDCNGQENVLTAENGGLEVFYLSGFVSFKDDTLGSCGVLYDGAYKTLFLSFSWEFLNNKKDTLIARTLKFFDQGTATGINDEPNDGVLPSGFALRQNYPNPFNPTTTIEYSIGADDNSSRAARTTLSVFNLLGRKVATLVDKVQSPGTYTVVWDGQDSSGKPVATGVYFYRLTHGTKSETRKMLLLK
ncbi:MAG: T9SS C-terminal target domain-containing protein, partial [Candidatus Zixiibacteriota bacterium]